MPEALAENHPPVNLPSRPIKSKPSVYARAANEREARPAAVIDTWNIHRLRVHRLFPHTEENFYSPVIDPLQVARSVSVPSRESARASCGWRFPRNENRKEGQHPGADRADARRRNWLSGCQREKQDGRTASGRGGGRRADLDRYASLCRRAPIVEG